MGIDWTNELKLKAMGKLGNKCVRCGFSDKRALQFDHVNGGGQQENHEIGRYTKFKEILAGSDKYQLLCANCNWIKRHENNEHGTHSVEKSSRLIRHEKRMREASLAISS